MNNLPPSSQQQHQLQDNNNNNQQDPVVKQEPAQLTSPLQSYQQPQSHQQQHFQAAAYHAQQQQPTSGTHTPSYGLPGSSAGPMSAFSALPPNPYSLHNHLLGLSMHGNATPSTATQGLGSPSFAQSSASGIASRGNNSGSTTPSMAHASAPSSPVLNNLQQQHYGNNGTNSQYGHNGGSNLYHQQGHQAQQHYHTQHSQQQQQQHHQQHQPTSSLASSFYPASPPHQHQQYQQQQQTAQHQFNSVPPQAPLRQQQQPLQYAPLVPPLSEAQYAQYHQLLGSPFSSAASTPYHSNQSTPYNSLPPSPTLEYQQLSGDPSQAQKPKRRQVKNACVNCQKACKKCDEGRPCTRCIKYGLTDTCVDSTRKVRKKGVKRGPYKRRPPPTQIGSASASTTPTLSHAVLATGAGAGPAGYMSEPVTALSSPTQSHMLPFTTSSSSSGMGHLSGQLDFGYDTSGGHGSSSNGGAGGYASFQSSRMENTYTPAYTTSYSGPGLYASYGMTSSNGGHQNGNHQQ